MNKHKVLSLFSGCGGLDLGFSGDFNYAGKYYEQQPFDVVWANDIDPNACKTYEAYFEHPIVCGDIRDILSGHHLNLLDAPLPQQVDVVLGGFPCQDFSHAGKRRGLASRRGTLYQAMVDVVKQTSPKVFVAENVKGLLTMDGGEALNKIIADFSALGYDVSYKLFNTSNYGVPQNRERVLIIGTHRQVLSPFDFDAFMPATNPRRTVGEVIGDLEFIAEGSVANHFWSKARKNKGQGNSSLDKTGFSPTMRAEHHGNIEFHWNGERRLSAREAARIQSFPDDMVFYPSTSSAYRQIGNAVPPVFAWHVAQWVENHLFNGFKQHYRGYVSDNVLKACI